MYQEIEIPVYDRNGNLLGHQVYEFDTDKVLGSGSFGTVYAARGIDENGNFKKYALKVMKKDEFRKSEFDILKDFYFAEEPLISGDYVCIIMEFIPGSNLSNMSGEVNPKIKALNFNQRINLINQILTDFSIMHHDTLSSSATFHGDLKGPNINIDVDNEQKTNPRVFDFSLAERTGSTDPNSSIKIDVEGNPYYFPIETLKGIFGIKTDIYMLVSVIAIILGEPNPYFFKEKLARVRKNKIRSRQENSDNLIPKKALSLTENSNYNHALKQASTPFSLNIINFPALYPDIDLRDIMLKFLNRMQHNFLEKRPDTLEALHFFTNFNYLTKLHDKTPNDLDSKKILIAKLLISAYDLSRINIGTPSFPEPLEQFDFANHLDFCDEIIKKFKANSLDQTIALQAHNLLQFDRIQETNTLKVKTINLIQELNFQNHPVLANINKHHEELLSLQDNDTDITIIDHEHSRYLYQLFAKIKEALSLYNSLDEFKDYQALIKTNIEASLIAFQTLTSSSKNQIELHKNFNLILRNLDEAINNVNSALQESYSKDQALLDNLENQFRSHPLYAKYKQEVKELKNKPQGRKYKLETLIIALYLETYINSRERKLFGGSAIRDPQAAWLEEQILTMFPDINNTVPHQGIKPTITNKILFYVGTQFPAFIDAIHQQLTEYKIDAHSQNIRTQFSNTATLLNRLGNGGFARASQFFTPDKRLDQYIDEATILNYFDTRMRLSNEAASRHPKK